MAARDYTFDLLDYKEPITKIYFVRHGETNGNKNGLILGTWDLNLNRTGIRQAKKSAQILAKICKKEKISYILCSPLKRTRQTARIISKTTNIKKIIIDKNLVERSEGTWQKKTYWEVRDIDPVNFKKWVRDPYKTKPPKGESVIDLINRMKKFYKKVLSQYKGKNIIVVTHSGPIRAFLLYILRAKPDKFWYFKTETGRITEIRVSKKHAMVWRLNS